MCPTTSYVIREVLRNCCLTPITSATCPRYMYIYRRKHTYTHIHVHGITHTERERERETTVLLSLSFSLSWPSRRSARERARPATTLLSFSLRLKNVCKLHNVYIYFFLYMLRDAWWFIERLFPLFFFSLLYAFFFSLSSYSIVFDYYWYFGVEQCWNTRVRWYAKNNPWVCLKNLTRRCNKTSVYRFTVYYFN